MIDELAGRLRARPEAVVLGVLAVAAVLGPIVVGKPAPVGVFALGAVAAGALALHGAGMVLVARADRCINLAQVQLGVFAGTLFAYLVHGRPLIRGAQSLCRPCVGSPGPESGIVTVNFIVAAVVALAAAAGLGWLVSAVVVRRLRGTSPVVLTVATAFVTRLLVGGADRIEPLLTTRNQRALNQVSGAAAPPVELTWRIGGATLHLPDLVMMVAAAAAVVGVTMWLQRTDAGRDLRAAASDPERAATLGIDAARASGRAWAIAGLLSGAAGVLTASAAGLGALGTGGLATGLLVRILAVAVAARLTSVAVAGWAALAIGMADAGATWSAGQALPLDGALVVIIAVLLVLQRRARTGGDRSEGTTWAAMRAPTGVPPVLSRLPEVRRARRFGLGTLVVVVVGLPWALSPAQSGLAAVAACTAVVGLSTLVVTGWAGQVSLGQLAFAAVGAFVAGATHLPLPLALVVGALVAAGVAVGIGIPSLRLRGLEPATVTLALALAVSAVVLNPTSLGRAIGKVGGDGLPFVDVRDPRVGWYVAAALAGGAAVLVSRFRDSTTGRALVAARDDEAAAASFGIDVLRARVVGFAAAGALAGVAGVLLVHLQGVVAPESFTPELGLAVFTTAVLGGLGTTAGPLLGFAFSGALAVASVPGAVVSLMAGAGGLALLMAAPGGLVEVAVAVRDAGLRRVVRRRRMVVPGFVSGAATGVAPIAPAPVLAGAAAAVAYDLPGQWGLPDR